MIIGEHNLIIGKINAVISDFSMSLFFYIENKIIFNIYIIKKYIKKILPLVNSPPLIN